MKIAILVDLTPLCISAVKMGASIAQKNNAELTLIHISEKGNDDKHVNDEMTKLRSVIDSKLKVELQVKQGSFMSLIPTVLQDLGIELAIVPTHGKVGLMQNLFGSNILKLVMTIPLPTLVIQEHSVLPKSGFSNILFPVGPHAGFHVKYEQTSTIAKLFGAKVIIYTVRKDVRGLSDQLRNNINRTKQYFEQEGIPFQEISDEPEGFSVGYAKHILDFANNNGTDLIAMMAEVSDDNGYIGRSDKENILLNAQQIPVLCTNG